MNSIGRGSNYLRGGVMVKLPQMGGGGASRGKLPFLAGTTASVLIWPSRPRMQYDAPCLAGPAQGPTTPFMRVKKRPRSRRGIAACERRMVLHQQQAVLAAGDSYDREPAPVTGRPPAMGEGTATTSGQGRRSTRPAGRPWPSRDSRNLALCVGMSGGA